MLTKVITEIIVCEYEKRIAKKVLATKPNDTGMMVSFRIQTRSGDRRTLQLLIWGAHNYVGVWVRVVDDVRADFAPESWTLVSEHDSAWRTDGVDRIISMFAPDIVLLESMSFDYRHGWYEEVYMGSEFEENSYFTQMKKSIQNRSYFDAAVFRESVLNNENTEI